MGKSRGDFADFLVKSGKLSEDQKEEVVAVAKSRSLKIPDAVSQLGYATSEEIARSLASFHRMDYINLEETSVPASVVELVPESVARENNVLPLAQENGSLKIAISDPDDIAIVDKLRFILNQQDIQLVLAQRDAIVQAINHHYGQTETQSVDSMLQEFTDTSIEFTEVEDEAAIQDDASAPIVKLVNLLLSEAISLRASDVHIEPFEDRVRVRYRIDGQLVERDSAPRRLLSAIITRVKIMGSIDITERRRPQDGRIKVTLGGKELDLRVSILPTNHGQAIVMRLLDKDNIKIGIRDLGFSEADYRTFTKIVKRPNGIFLVTGPTGSGKTTTLYAALNELNRPDRKIITAEDPVEYYLAGVNQVQVRSDIGLTFQSIIRAMLRQAPNIILVGEIRDRETADIAIQASLTGHLVFSTLHTNDAPGSITRLVDMGVQPFLVASSLMAAMAQRLVRKVCPKCKRSYSPRPEELESVRLTKDRVANASFQRGAGCKYCNKLGYRGRIAIFELMPITPSIREMTFRRESHLTIRKEALAEGMRSLFEDGIEKAVRGVTTIEEVVEIAGLGDEELVR